MSYDAYLRTKEGWWSPCWLCKGSGRNPRDPDKVCWDCGGVGKQENHGTIWEQNITWNLNTMWYAVGWDFHAIPNGTPAAEIGEAALAALQQLQADPERFKAMNPPNGWGRYEHLVEFFSTLVTAIEMNPTAVWHCY